MRAIQDAARVQKKPIYERSNGSCELAQLLNARSTSELANAWGPFVEQSYPQIPRTRPKRKGAGGPLTAKRSAEYDLGYLRKFYSMMVEFA